MKKKILFLCSNMGCGGFQKSLLALLQHFDYRKYDVDLLLFDPSGIFFDLLPEEVNLLPIQIPSAYFESTFPAIRKLWKENHFLLMFWRIFCGAVFAVDKGYGAWFLSRAIPKLQNHYDSAIDYNGQQILYYMVDYIDAERKITYFHSDYEKWAYYRKMDKHYFGKVDAIVSVSEDCVHSLRKYFPECSEKMFCVENIISAKTVIPRSSDTFIDSFDGFRLVSLGRVVLDKGIDLALEACRILKERGENIRWYWIGPCVDFSTWKKKIVEYFLEDSFFFLGERNDPYSYLKDAFLLVHPSRFEGKAVAVEEAKQLALPVVVCNYSTVRNQIQDGINGKITEMDGNAVAEGISFYLHHPEVRERQHRWLIKNQKGNEKEAEKVYALIEGDILHG